MRTIDFNKFVKFLQKEAEACERLEKTAIEHKNYDYAIRANETANTMRILKEIVESNDRLTIPEFLEVTGEELEE